MLPLCWIVMVSTVAAISVPGINLDKNYGINVRLGQRGLSYAGQMAVNDLYEKYKKESLPDMSVNSGGTSFSISNVKVPDLSKPTFNIKIDPNQGVSSTLLLADIKIAGDFLVKYTRGWLINQSGSFTANAGQISSNTSLDIGRERSGRPSVSVKSCRSTIGTFKVDIESSGLIGWVMKLLGGQMSHLLKESVRPMLCNQIRKLVNVKVNQKLKEIKVMSRLQKPDMLIDYSLAQSPKITSDYIDTNVKGDVQWKGRRTGTPTALRSSWPDVPDSRSKMVTVYLTDYIMNAMGKLLQMDGSLTLNVTREMMSSSIGPQMALECPDSICLGTLFPELAKQYPDGWLEAGFLTTLPPVLTIQNDVLNSNFSTALEVYVKRPGGQKIKAVSVSLSMGIPLSLKISDNKLQASFGNPSFGYSTGVAGAITNGITNFTSLLSEGFTMLKLNELGKKGFELPTIRGVSLLKPKIHVRDGVIAISSDVNYTDK